MKLLQIESSNFVFNVTSVRQAHYSACRFNLRQRMTFLLVVLNNRQIPSTPRPIVGGYFTIDIDDDVKEIALFASTAITGKSH
jgi:hypothetical protein